MLSKSDNFMQVLLGEEPDWVPVECPANPDYGQNAYEFVTYEGALPPKSGGIDMWGTHWAGTGTEEILMIETSEDNYDGLRDKWIPAEIPAKNIQGQVLRFLSLRLRYRSAQGRKR